MKLFLYGLPVVMAAVVGAVLRTAAPLESARGSWPMLPRESAVIEGHNARFQAMEDQLAPIISNADTRRAIVQFVVANADRMATQRRDAEEAAERRLGVAVVATTTPTGMAWVAVR
jgi:hypothetical protein